VSVGGWLNLRSYCCAGVATKGKASKDKKETGGRQTTLFGLPALTQPDKKASGTKKKTVGESQEQDSQATVIDESQNDEQEMQMTDVTMDESQPQDETAQGMPMGVMDPDETREDSPPIDWPASPAAKNAVLVDA
jgi:chromosome transmission fidelity protein 4